MSYQAVRKLSDKWLQQGGFYRFKSKAEYESFQLPFSELAVGDQISIKGCKKVWTVGNTNEQSNFAMCDEIFIMATITIHDDQGYYASILREDIEQVLKDEIDVQLFHTNGQLTFEFFS